MFIYLHGTLHTKSISKCLTTKKKYINNREKENSNNTRPSRTHKSRDTQTATHSHTSTATHSHTSTDTQTHPYTVYTQAHTLTTAPAQTDRRPHPKLQSPLATRARAVHGPEPPMGRPKHCEGHFSPWPPPL